MTADTPRPSEWERYVESRPFLREQKRSPSVERDGMAAWLGDEIAWLESIKLTEYGEGALSAFKRVAEALPGDASFAAVESKRDALRAENARLREALSQIEAVACTGAAPDLHASSVLGAFADALRWIERAALSAASAPVTTGEGGGVMSADQFEPRPVTERDLAVWLAEADAAVKHGDVRLGQFVWPMTVRSLIAEISRLRTALAAAEARGIAKGREEERERIIARLWEEGDVTPCSEDASVVQDCAWLVRCDFSYGDVEALQKTQDTPLRALPAPAAMQAADATTPDDGEADHGDA